MRKAGNGTFAGMVAAVAFLVAGVIFSAGGCASVVVAPMREVKASNRVFLHESPKAGDYAVYGNADGSHLMKREIIEIRGDVIEIRTSFPKTPAIISPLRDISFGSFVRRDGTVLEAWMLDSRTGKKTALVIARAGDYNYIGEGSLMTLPSPETIITKAGTFRTDKVVVFTQRMNLLGVALQTTSVWYFDPHVKFGLVRQHNISETDASIVEVAAFINKMSPAPQLARSLNSYIIEKSRHHTFISQFDLVETN